MLDPARRLPFNGIRDGRGYTWGHPVTMNRLRFRERDIVHPKPKGVTRVMVLGDSLTFGNGLATEERYTDLLELRLRDRFLKKKIEVLNFGVESASTVFESGVLSKGLAWVDPDLIIIGFCLNDPQPGQQGDSPEKLFFDRHFGVPLRRVEVLSRKIFLPHVGTAFRKGMYGLAEAAGFFPPWMKVLDQAYRKESAEWKEFEKALASIKEMSDKKKLPPPVFIVLNQGVTLNRPTDYRNPDKNLRHFLTWYRQAEEAAARLGFETVNVEDEIRSQLPNRILSVNPADNHPSAELNQLYAKKLAEKLADKLK